MKSYFCVICGTPLLPQYNCSKQLKDCSFSSICIGVNIPSKLPALSKGPVNAIGDKKFQYPINRQPSLVNMNLSTLHYGRRRFNYFILMSFIMVTGGFALIL